MLSLFSTYYDLVATSKKNNNFQRAKVIQGNIKQMLETSIEKYISINEFWYILLELETEMFSGTIELEDKSEKVNYGEDGSLSSWRMYFYLGRLVYATGGVLPVRRWIRVIKKFLPQISLREDNIYKKEKEYKTCWEYELLSDWYLDGKIKREQVIEIINALIHEVFFDLHRVRITTPKIKKEEISFSHQWISNSLEQYITQSKVEWKYWQEKGIADLDPEKRPVIRRVEELALKMSSDDHYKMVQLFKSPLTMRELSGKIKKPLADLTISLLPYLRSGIMEMIEVEDLVFPERKSIRNRGNKKNQVLPLVACVDDNIDSLQRLNEIVEKAGCRVIKIQDPIQAIPILLDQQPDLILVNLKTSVTNGYQLCELMRTISIFKSTAIVIITEEERLINRVRAKMAGATEFMSKGIERDKIIKTIFKYVMN